MPADHWADDRERFLCGSLASAGRRGQSRRSHPWTLPPRSAKRRRSIGTREAAPPQVAVETSFAPRSRDPRIRTRDMAKKIAGYIKLQIPAGKANPSPPVGPALGQRGLNIMEFCKAFNAATQKEEPGMPIPVVITAYGDRPFTFTPPRPPVSHFLKKAARLEKGSQTPGKAV